MHGWHTHHHTNYVKIQHEEFFKLQSLDLRREKKVFSILGYPLLGSGISIVQGVTHAENIILISAYKLLYMVFMVVQELTVVFNSLDLRKMFYSG